MFNLTKSEKPEKEKAVKHPKVKTVDEFVAVVTDFGRKFCDESTDYFTEEQLANMKGLIQLMNDMIDASDRRELKALNQEDYREKRKKELEAKFASRKGK